MTQVRILPEILSNQIAAGEVVERPASVVKELVENSIDAGATAITIEIERGGKSLIRVSDNGTGLSRDDALLSIERYATSKIFTKEDLFNISTMGFRGEALPSIASVSRFTMVTRTDASAVATRIEIAGGRVVNVTDAGAPVGTMVEVKALFYNTPARKKFLKTDNTENSHISDFVSSVALAHPDIRVRFISNNRLQKSFSGSDDLFSRCVQVLGREVSGKLVKIQHQDDYIKIKGFCVHPQITRSSSARIHFFVNYRLVHDRGLVSALFQGYRGRIMKGRFPLAVLFINIGYDQVDVNVHPSKREIKFFNYQRVYQAVARSVEEGFLTAQAQVGQYSAPAFTAPGQRSESHPAARDNDFIAPRVDPPPQVAQSVINWTQEVKDPAVPEPSYYEEIPPVQVSQTQVPEPSLTEPEVRNHDLKIVGQIMGTYIIVESDEGMHLVDQHAAHERIVYESLKKKHLSMGIARQQLLVPETIELSYKESDQLAGMLEDLNRLGMEIEHFGGTTYVVKAVPDLISQKQIQSLVIDMVEAASVDRNTFAKDGWLDECLILMACHNALRANQAMHRMEMEQLLADLEKCDNPMHCPHGRPIRIVLTKKDLEKLFKRVV